MVIEKTANFLSKAKVIYTVIFAIAYGAYHVATFAADQRYMQISNYKKIHLEHEESRIKSEVRSLNRELAKLDTQLLYASSEQQKTMLQALIIQLKKDIKDLKGE